MSNRIAVFNDGNIQQLSSPSKLYEEPENSFVAKFIGENNTIEGIVKEISSDTCKVETNKGETIITNPITIKNIGEKTRMSLRPERVILNPSDNFANTFTSVVKEIIYHGDHTRIRVSLLDQDNFILKVPNSSNIINIKENDTISLGWSANDCRALDL
jgi:putative spermidine/putrescine transport system ATP-binding protein